MLVSLAAVILLSSPLSGVQIVGPPAQLPAVRDISIGSHPSAVQMLIRSFETNAQGYNSDQDYSHVTSTGYALQGMATFLKHAQYSSLPGGEATRDRIVELAITEITELLDVSTSVSGTVPSFGAHQEMTIFGRQVPAYTPFAWQTGMAALGIVSILEYLHGTGTRYQQHQAVVQRALDVLQRIMTAWNGHFIQLDTHTGFFPYSFLRQDRIVVHNVNGLMAMTSQILGEITGDQSLTWRPRLVANLLALRWRTAEDGLDWHYADDNWPQASRISEDVSHGGVTMSFMAFGRDRNWFGDDTMLRVSNTIINRIWTGYPQMTNVRVDGTPPSDLVKALGLTRASFIGMAAIGGMPGARLEVFEFARSIFASSYLGYLGKQPGSGQTTVDAARLLGLARLLAQGTPSHMSQIAGPGDQRYPTRSTQNGVRFYTVDWGDSGPTADGAGVRINARSATAYGSNILVDIDPDETRPVAVSITYAASAHGVVQQWDGQAYTDIAPIPATRRLDGQAVWMRTTFLLEPSLYRDYQSVPGKNILLQFTHGAHQLVIHRMEATLVD